MTVRGRLDELAAAHALPAGSAGRLAQLLQLVADEHASITSVREPLEAVDVHVADSLAGVEPLRGSPTVADLGSGGGFPGLVLALALPDTHFTLVESVGRKARFLESAAHELGLVNVRVVTGRAEQLRPEMFHVVTARALAALGVVLEYAAPILRPEGLMLAWKGRRDDAEAGDGVAAAQQLGMSEPAWRPVTPYPGVERHLVASRKVAPTPAGFPRRPGMATKRPLRA